MGPEEEFELYDRDNSWPRVFQQLHATDAVRKREYSLHESKRAENRQRNRYRDVIPYDHSRIKLHRSDIDYINASLVVSEEADRAYILTQGPLPDTSGHFWLMVWEQKSRAVLMLNRIIEKGQLKCHAYFPSGVENEGDDEMTFQDVGLKVTYVEERDSNANFTVRAFYITDVESSESREVLQFHYTAWPDFGVPSSPGAFLDFLWSVRQSGALDAEVNGPPVIHCSAGIGRSGTFCLVDACLVLIEKHGRTSDIRVLETLMDMRRYRMGLVQTYDQLRFSYLAIIEGTKRIIRIPSRDSGYDNSIEEHSTNDRQLPVFPTEYSSEEEEEEMEEDDIDEEIPDDIPPPIPPRTGRATHLPTGNNGILPGKQNGGMVNGAAGGGFYPVVVNGREDEIEEDVLLDQDNKWMEDLGRNHLRWQAAEVQRRPVAEREKNPAEEIACMRRHQMEKGIWPPPSSPKRSVRLYVIGAVVVAVLAAGSYSFYRHYYR